MIVTIESILAFFNGLIYIVTYVSLVICLFTVIATFVWYVRVRKTFSSPIKHSGLSVARLILGTTVLIIIVQISIMFLYPDFLHQIAFAIFLVSLVVFAVRNAFALGGAYLHKRRERYDLNSDPREEKPLVTMIVPAYNEEKAIGKTIEALLKLSYINKEIIIVNDGSTDATLKVAKKYANNNLVRIVSKQNAGKWSALNEGVKVAKGEFVVCIDADTLLDPDALSHLTKHFKDPKIAAVAGNVKVGNRRNLLTKLQALEYIVGINLHRRSEAFLQNVTVVPGPIGAFRASVLKEIHLFEGDTFAEDADITLKILKAGYKTTYESRAIGYTEAPMSMKNLAKQRYRWFRGGFQVYSKYKGMTFNKRYGRTGTFVVPWTIFNGVIYPWLMFFAMMWLLVFAFNPISPYTIYQPRIRSPPEWAHGQPPAGRGGGTQTGSTQIGIAIDFFQAIPYIYLFWFLAFIVIEVFITAYALSLDLKEKKTLILYSILHRLFFFYILDILRMLSQLEETLHYPMKWEKMEHRGMEPV